MTATEKSRTLGEAHAYTYAQTVRSSGETLSLQHPTYSYDVKGRSDVVITNPGGTGRRTGRLRLPKAGVYVVSEERDGGPIVAEVAAPVDRALLALPEGRYFVQQREPDELREYNVRLEADREVDLASVPSRTLKYDHLVRKGGGERSSVHGFSLMGGGHGTVLAGEGVVPSMVLGYNADLPWLSAGLRVRGGSAELRAVDGGLSSRHYELGVGAVVQHYVDLRPLSLAFGALVEGVHHTQRFDAGDRIVTKRDSTGLGFGALFSAEHKLYEGLSLRLEGGPMALLYPQAKIVDGKESTKELRSTLTWWLAAGVVWRLEPPRRVRSRRRRRPSRAARACGKPLLTDEYRGAPFWTLEGGVERSDAHPRGTILRMALFFSPRADVVDPEMMVEHAGSGVSVEVPSSYALNVFALPGPEHMMSAPDGSPTGYAVSRILVYEDTSGDGHHQKGERFLGLDRTSAVLYLPSDMPAGTTIARGSLTAGFHRIPLPQPCDFAPPPATTPGSCDVPLGEGCAKDSECGPGSCLRETNEPWAGGYCVVYEPPRSDCRPGAGVYVQGPTYARSEPGVQGYYLRSCAVDADCARRGPREAGYVCDPSLLACISGPHPVVATGQVDGVDLEPLCAGARRKPPPK